MYYIAAFIGGGIVGSIGTFLYINYQTRQILRAEHEDFVQHWKNSEYKNQDENKEN